MILSCTLNSSNTANLVQKTTYAHTLNLVKSEPILVMYSVDWSDCGHTRNILATFASTTNIKVLEVDHHDIPKSQSVSCFPYICLKWTNEENVELTRRFIYFTTCENLENFVRFWIE